MKGKSVALTAETKAGFSKVGQESLSIVNSFGTKASGNILSHRRVTSQERGLSERFLICFAKTRPHKVVRGGT